MEIWEKVRNKMDKRGLSYEELSREFYVRGEKRSASGLFRLISGKIKSPSHKNISMLSEILKINMKEFENI